MKAIYAGIVAVLLAGCTAAPVTREVVRTVRVEVPVYVRPAPTQWMLEPVFGPEERLDIFVSPDAPGVILGVTREGLEDFWRAIDRPMDRIAVWQAWATNLEVEDSAGLTTGADKP